VNQIPVLKKIPQPDSFLEFRVHHLNMDPGLTAACVGYEHGTWRREQFAEHVLEWLPEFALSPNENEALRTHNAVSLIRRTAKSIYATDKYRRRGEFGELLLHILMRQAFHTIPAISKIYYKDSANDTVKGFDAVHVLNSQPDLELWLGEAKFYTNIGDAITAVAAELNDHTERDYIRGEFAIIGNKVDDSWPGAKALRDLIHRNRSLDEVFSRLCIPVLLTYDSPTIGRHDCVDPSYICDFTSEVKQHYKTFGKAGLPRAIRIHLFLLPLERKSELVESLHERLNKWQQA